MLHTLGWVFLYLVYLSDLWLMKYCFAFYYQMVQIKEKVKQTHKEYQEALKVKEPRYSTMSKFFILVLPKVSNR